jgi:nucleotide-binding universal stress UspA family protein
LKKILCATDGTDHSAHAIELAAGLSTVFSANLTICVVNIVRGRTGGPFLYAWDDDEVRKILGDAAAHAEKAGAGNVEKLTLRGREAAAAIVQFSEENGFDHIVVGTGDRHGISRLVLGSVAADISGRAHCSVTVVR